MHLVLVSVLQELIMSRDVLVRDQKDLPEPITRALDVLAADPYRDWGARELAAAAGVNYSSFRALFREHMHETVHEHLQQTRLDLAQLLLSDRRLRIKEIAERLHFASEYYFSNFFRKKTGIRPTEFRKHLSGPYPVA
jgi:AraC-like DNA-binding protein